MRAPSPWACRWWTAAAIVLATVLFAQAETKALRSIGNDFTAYLEAARALAAGGNPYLVSPMFPYSYPMTLAWLLIPLSVVPKALAAAAWFAISVFAFWRVVNEAAAAGDGPISRCAAIALAVVIAIALLQIVQNELLNGQINLAVAAASLAAVSLSERQRRVPAAALWGLGIALKLFPLILAPWFLLRRRWTELFGGIAIAAALCLVPVLWTGSDSVRWTLDYFRKIAGGEAGAVGVPDFIHLNVARAIAHAAGLASTPAWLMLATCAALVGTAIVLDARAGDADSARSRRRAIVYLSLVVLLSPKSETHHMIFSIPAVIVLAVRARTWIRFAALSILIVIFNVGYVTAAVRDLFLLTFSLGIAAWCMADD